MTTLVTAICSHVAILRFIYDLSSYRFTSQWRGHALKAESHVSAKVVAVCPILHPHEVLRA